MIICGLYKFLSDVSRKYVMDRFKYNYVCENYLHKGVTRKMNLSSGMIRYYGEYSSGNNVGYYEIC
ncbi:hypothetical protein EMUR_01815 [Ehrlichia muris AS145]|uniref:Uncharacterized protein n=1 Tax=Ehrlichia muris AS145 TaxID=1423892 RepID=V9R7A4_9RICK|nr:hypothetical protein EMUR_01815 [Ehrlichia muris AS145]